MTVYWLTPIIHTEPLTLGAERMCCESSRELEQFRNAAAACHPRLLPLFKANLLLAGDEDAEEACGTEDAELDLAQPGEIVFDGSALRLSHCAEAFMDRLLDVGDALSLFENVKDSGRGLSPQEAVWAGKCLEWLGNGCRIILLREDGW